MTTTPDPNAMPDPNQSPTPAGPPPGPMGYNAPSSAPMGYAPPGGPMGYAPPPATPAKKTNWLGIIVLVAIVAVIGVGFWLFRDRLSSNVTDLAVGDCFVALTDMNSITDVQHQPCNSPHYGEVIANLTHPALAGEAYPVISGFDDYVVENCVPVFDSYTGRDWATDVELTLAYFSPTLTGWGDGDRGFTCYVRRSDGELLGSSVHGLGSSPLP